MMFHKIKITKNSTITLSPKLSVCVVLKIKWID